MNERDWADRFSRDVDNLLNEARRMDSEPTPTEYRQALDLAHTLATTDFSTGSQVRRPLRRRLLNWIDAREGGQGRNTYPIRPFFWGRRSTVTLTAVLLVFLVGILVLAIYPPARAVAQETLERVVPLYCVVRTEGGYVVYDGTRGPLGLMLWKPITPPLPPNPMFYVMEMSAGPQVCPEGPGAILWGYARLGLLLAGLLVGVTLLVYSPARARMANGIRTLRERMWRPRKERPVPIPFWQRHPAVTLAAVVLAALLVIALAWPGALTAAAQGIEDFVQSLSLGPHTSVRQVNPEWATAHPQRPLPATPVVEQRGRLWVIRTAIGNFGGDVLPGNDAAVRRFTTFDEAQAATTFGVRRPSHLPAGYALREAMVTPSDRAFLFYDGPYGDIILVQAPVYTRVERLSETEMVGTSSSIGILTDGSIEEVTLNGRRAAWVEDRSLVWEAEGISHLLGGSNLSLEEAIRIAESLE